MNAHVLAASNRQTSRRAVRSNGYALEPVTTAEKH